MDFSLDGYVLWKSRFESLDVEDGDEYCGKVGDLFVMIVRFRV